MKGNKLIGTLIDAWDGTPNDERDAVADENPALFAALEAIMKEYAE